MIGRLVQIALMGAATGLTYWAWLSLNVLRGTALFEYRYVILVSGTILVFSAAQAIAGWIDVRLNPEETH